jgi:hypothetical protein
MKIFYPILVFAVLLGAPAEAHSFLAEGGAYDMFVEGTTVIFKDVRLLLPIVALGLLISLWKADGLISAWPANIVGNVLGVPLAVLVNDTIILIYLLIGVLVALIAALAPKRNAFEIRGFALVLGTVSMLSALEGHEFFELPIAIYLGLIFGLNLVLAATANISGLILSTFRTKWVKIAIRAICSWTAAIGILIFAVNFQ